MRKLFGSMLLLPWFPSLAAADAQAVYQPLAFLAGHCWKGSFPGGKQTDEQCFTWIYEGKFLRDRHTVGMVRVAGVGMVGIMQGGAKLIAHREFLDERARKLPRRKRDAHYLCEFDT